MTNIRKVHITDETTGNTQSVDTSGHADMVQHAHPEGGFFNFAFNISATTDFILLDLSDTTNFPHINTGSIHMAWMLFSAEASTSPAANYDISLGFLENVDGTDGDYYEIFTITGSKTAGLNKFEMLNAAPDGPWCKSSKVVTNNILTNQTAFNTTTNMKTILDPATADTPPGSGDIILRVTIGAGNINLNLSGNYHSHT